MNILNGIQKDIGDIKGNVGSVKATIDAHDHTLSKYDDEFAEIKNTLTRIESKDNARYTQHQQWVATEIEKNEAFATREINELHKIVKPIKDDYDIRKENGVALKKGIAQYVKSGAKYIIGGSIAYFIFGKAIILEWAKDYFTKL